MKKFILFALLALLLPSSAWSYDVGEVFTANIGTEESPYYMRFKKISERFCVIYGEKGNPAIDKESAGPNGDGFFYLSEVDNMVIAGISSYAFANCSNIHSLQIENWYHEIEIGEYAFYNCGNLEIIAINSNSSGICALSPHVFDGCVNLVNSLIRTNYIPEYAFANCRSLEYVSFMDVSDMSRQLVIGERAFYNCSSLKEITASGIGREAFVGTNVSSIVLVGSSYISDYAFFSNDGDYYGKKSVSVYLDASVSSCSFSEYAFEGCDITSITVDESNPIYDGRNGCNAVIDSNRGTIVLGCNRTVIPTDDNVQSIDLFAFPCHIDEMTIPNNIKTFNIYAFKDCDILRIEGLPKVFSEKGFGAPLINNNHQQVFSTDYSNKQIFGAVYLPVQLYGSFHRFAGELYPFLESKNNFYAFGMPSYNDDYINNIYFRVPSGMKAYIPVKYQNGRCSLKNVDTVIGGEGVLLVDNNFGWEPKHYVDVLYSEFSENNYDGNLLRYNNSQSFYDENYVDENGYGYDGEVKNYCLKDFNSKDIVFQFDKVEGRKLLGVYESFLSVPSESIMPDIIQCYQAKNLIIDVTDEFTYYTEESTHVENATVIIYEKVSKKEFLIGKTGKDGTFLAENILPGDYIIHVEAKNHESKDWEFHKNADSDERMEAPISFTGGVTCEFIVEETSVPDLYNLSVNYSYAVDIPLPFVSLSVPSSINVDDMEVGESIEFEATLFNNGLIRVNDVALLVPENIPFMSFVPQQEYQGLSIEAKQSVIISVKATKTAEGDCTKAKWGVKWSYPLGESNVYKDYCNIPMSMENCPLNINEVHDYVGGSSGSYQGANTSATYIDLEGKKTENISTDKPFITKSVDVAIGQALSLERQAFRGTMTMNNTYPASLGAIKEIQFNLAIVDTETGDSVSSREFEVQLEKLNGFSGEESMNGPWSLASGKQGEISVLMIPTKYAAPTKAKNYKVVGSISYIDPLLSLSNPDESRKEENLIPKTITVNPTPQLVLDYFIPKKIVGDDPMTEDEVEASEAAELALLIKNEGYGDAKNLKITTKQPEIVDNRDGLLIDFAITGGTVNGKPVGLTEDEELVSDFGTLKARSTAYAQWWLTSTLLGRITKYDVSYLHETGYDNENLSLLNAVNAHSLVRSIKRDMSLFGFLTDDEETSEYHFYGADGSVEDVQRVDDIDVTKKNQYSYIVRFVATESVYIYGYIQDPSDGEGKLKGGNLIDYWRESVRFSDEAPARWMKAPAMHEKTIHFVCRVPEANKAYELTLELDNPDNINSVVISSEKDEWFTLSGLRVSKPNAKGVYIHNGRKVLVK